MGPSPIVLVALGIAALGGACARQAPRGEILVGAASSLREVLEGTKAAFEAGHPGTKLRFSFEASSTLARKIREGAPFDVFLAADPDTVGMVSGELDAATVLPFLSNRLALVRGATSPPVRGPAELVRHGGRIALAGPAVPAGKYARAYLGKAGLLEALAPRIVEAESVRAALFLVESGAADFAFVYRTDAAIARSATLAWTDDRGEGPPIRYVAAVLSRAVPPAARDYVRWLRGPIFLAAAERLGFLAP